MGIIAVLWEKWREFRRDFYKITLAATITPLMYLIVFGLGIQTTSHGEPYLNFLVPGIVAMSTMTGSFSAVAQNMSVQRLYEKALDQVMVSPTPLWQFILGQVIGGSLRGMYAAGIIMLITLPIAADLTFNGWSFLVMFLNGFEGSSSLFLIDNIGAFFNNAKIRDVEVAGDVHLIDELHGLFSNYFSFQNISFIKKAWNQACPGLRL